MRLTGIKKIASLTGVTIALILLASCKSSDDGQTGTELPAEGEAISNWGNILATVTPDSEIQISGLFFRSTKSVEQKKFETEFFHFVDQCEVEVRSETDDPIIGLEDFYGPIVFINAGDIVTVSNNNNTWVELIRTGITGIFRYATALKTISGPVPPTLVFDVPGGDYPAFDNVTMRFVEILNLTEPAANTALTPATNFSWEPGKDPEAVIRISADSINQATGQVLTLECDAQDDGQFSLPADIRAQMGEDFSDPTPNIRRRLFHYVFRDNAAMIFTSEASGF